MGTHFVFCSVLGEIFLNIQKLLQYFFTASKGETGLSCKAAYAVNIWMHDLLRTGGSKALARWDLRVYSQKSVIRILNAARGIFIIFMGLYWITIGVAVTPESLNATKCKGPFKFRSDHKMSEGIRCLGIK